MNLREKSMSTNNRDQLGSTAMKERGFTLIELVIVVVILGILAGIAVVAVNGLTSTSAQSACQADYKSVEVAAESFKAQTGAYPGGPYYGSFTVTAVAAPAGYMTGLANATPTPTWNGVQYLMQGSDTDAHGNKIGPWLRDLPLNGSHYQIALSNDGSDTISVYTTGAAPTLLATGCAGAR